MWGGIARHTGSQKVQLPGAMRTEPKVQQPARCKESPLLPLQHNKTVHWRRQRMTRLAGLRWPIGPHTGSTTPCSPAVCRLSRAARCPTAAGPGTASVVAPLPRRRAVRTGADLHHYRHRCHGVGGHHTAAKVRLAEAGTWGLVHYSHGRSGSHARGRYGVHQYDSCTVCLTEPKRTKECKGPRTEE
jgi:hypothetical protein